MIEIRYLQAESGANRFGTCNCCGKSSGEDPLMISVKFSYYGHGTLICLCDDCKKKLMEVLPPANNSEIPNSSDAISRQAVLDALNNIEIPRNASWYQYYQQALTAVDKLPPAQPEPSQVAKDIARILENGQDMRVIAQPGRIKGHWIIRETSFGDTEARCSHCGFTTLVDEPGNGLHMVSDLNFCPNCGADMREVTT
jgi:hypothetical protein